MKTKTIFFVLLFALPFLGKAQYSIGLNSYRNFGTTANGEEPQFAFGMIANKQISKHFDTQIKALAVFSQEGVVFFSFGCWGPATFINTTPIGYEKTPSSVEVSYLVRFHPVSKHRKWRVMAGTGLAYRRSNQPLLDNTTPAGTIVSLAPNLNQSLGLPLTLGFEVDITKNVSLSVEEENRVFVSRYYNDRFYYGASLNLVYHLFAKK
ncbi:MAG: hypothetical protein RLZZ292_1352 [Bacteroidota bacterium]|jgi:hypothetical protein